MLNVHNAQLKTYTRHFMLLACAESGQDFTALELLTGQAAMSAMPGFEPAHCSVQWWHQSMLCYWLVQSQGKVQQALEVLTGKAGQVITIPAERRRLQASLHVSCLH